MHKVVPLEQVAGVLAERDRIISSDSGEASGTVTKIEIRRQANHLGGEQHEVLLETGRNLLIVASVKPGLLPTALFPSDFRHFRPLDIARDGVYG